jgi:hypothetical protein
MSYNGGSGGSVHVPAQNQGDFTYNIVNGGGVTFAAQNPIWIQQGTAKPLGPVVDSQITDVAGGGTTKLTFTDLNSGNPITLTYSLHFSDGSKIDPIIENGGGTGPPPPPPPLSDQSGQAAPSAVPGSREFMGADVTMLLIGAVVVFLLGVLIGRFSK